MGCFESQLLLLILVTISLDPLFFYIPVVNNDSNCLGFDNKLRIVVVVFRTFVDGLYIILWWRQGFPFLIKNRRILSWVAAILATLPLPQVVVYAVSWRLLTVRLLKFLTLIQFVPRVYLIIPSYKYARKGSRRSINMLFAAAFYLLMFIVASNFLGAFWYLRTIERNMDCWKKACKTRGLCGVSSLYCDSSSTDNRYLNEFCPIPPAPNSTFFDYGIYLDAFQRDIIGSKTNFLDKLYYCLWWGLQSLSSFGQNLEPGTYIWDNFFAIFIDIAGLVLFALLIGNMQVYLQKKTTEWDAMNVRRSQIAMKLTFWRPFYSLPMSVRSEVVSCHDQKWLETTVVDVESLLNNIPLKLRKDIRPYICKDLFSTVEEFKKLPEDVKKELRDRAEARVFPKSTIIIAEGNPIYEMVHIVHGKVLTYKKDVKTTLEARDLKNSECFGEEVLQSALLSSTPIYTIATKSFQSVTKVEAFTLSFDAIVATFNKFGWQFSSRQKEWAISVIMGALEMKVRAKKNQGQVLGTSTMGNGFTDDERQQ